MFFFFLSYYIPTFLSFYTLFLLCPFSTRHIVNRLKLEYPFYILLSAPLMLGRQYQYPQLLLFFFPLQKDRIYSVYKIRLSVPHKLTPLVISNKMDILYLLFPITQTLKIHSYVARTPILQHHELLDFFL